MIGIILLLPKLPSITVCFPIPEEGSWGVVPPSVRTIQTLFLYDLHLSIPVLQIPWSINMAHLRTMIKLPPIPVTKVGHGVAWKKEFTWYIFEILNAHYFSLVHLARENRSSRWWPQYDWPIHSWKSRNWWPTICQPPRKLTSHRCQSHCYHSRIGGWVSF